MNIKPRPIFQRWLDILFPPSCPGCEGMSTYGLCSFCRSSIKPQSVFIGDVSIYAAGFYETALRHAILLAKLKGYTYLIYDLAILIIEALPIYLLETFPVAVVPLPPSPQRYRERGYHIPYLIALELVRQIPNFKYRPELLQLRHSTGEQKKLDRAGRFANVSDAYNARNAQEQYILLVDDVLTTGATAYTASKELYEMGALRVDVAVAGLRRS